MSAKAARGSFAFLLVLAAACGSVRLPDEQLYRLEVPPLAAASARGPAPGGAASSAAAPAPGGAAAPAPRELPLVLRVARLQLGADLAGGPLLVASGPVRLQPFVFHRWAGPLDSLVTDAFVSALARSRAFARVKGPDDAGGEDLVLGGRILDFHQVHQDGRPAAVVTVDLLLTRGDEQLLRTELRHVEPVANAEPEALVRALSAALGHVLREAIARCVFADAAATTDAEAALRENALRERAVRAVPTK